MTFIETPVFSTAAKGVLDEGELRELQIFLLRHPGAGSLITGTGGLRKLRWKAEGKSRRGGLRVIYYWMMANHVIYLLYLYKKSKKDDLNGDEIKVLRRLLEEG